MVDWSAFLEFVKVLIMLCLCVDLICLLSIIFIPVLILLIIPEVIGVVIGCLVFLITGDGWISFCCAVAGFIGGLLLECICCR
jgi:membrane associated rhomboid family serine protease